jgi:hypothetical protein
MTNNSSSVRWRNLLGITSLVAVRFLQILYLKQKFILMVFMSKKFKQFFCYFSKVNIHLLSILLKFINFPIFVLFCNI